MLCKIDGCGRPVENVEKQLCSTHSRQERKNHLEGCKEKKFNKIKSFSDKKMKEVSEYSERKKKFFENHENRICRVCGGNGADSIHHSIGKVGYFDNESRLKGVTLLLDERFWIPIHSFKINPEYGMSCHRYIEDRPELARKLGVTKSRLSSND